MTALGLPTLGLDDARVVIAHPHLYADEPLEAACTTVMTFGAQEEFDRARLLRTAVLLARRDGRGP